MLTVLPAFIVACSDDNEDEWNTEVLAAKDGKKLKVRTDTLCLFPTNEFPVGRSEPVNPEDVEVLKRFMTVRRDPFWMKAKFGGWSMDLGLSPERTYIIRREYYYQLLAKNKIGKVVVPFVVDERKTGFVESENIGLMYGFQYDDLYTKDSMHTLIGNYRTMIIHIGYDDEGNTVGRYFPCDPYELEWHFSWYDESFILP